MSKLNVLNLSYLYSNIWLCADQVVIWILIMSLEVHLYEIFKNVTIFRLASSYLSLYSTSIYMKKKKKNRLRGFHNSPHLFFWLVFFNEDSNLITFMKKKLLVALSTVHICFYFHHHFKIFT